MAIYCFPSLSQHWDESHPRKWRPTHFILSIVVISSLGFIFTKANLRSKILYVCMVVLFGIEAGIGLARYTTQAGQVHWPCLYIRNTCETGKYGPGCFYWIRGRPLPAAQVGYDHIVLLPPEWEKGLEREAIIVEGPFGPNIGIYSWICRCLGKLMKQKPLSRNTSSLDIMRELLRRPVQLPKGDRIGLLVEISALFRAQSLWTYLLSSSIEGDKAAKFYLFVHKDYDEKWKEVSENLFGVPSGDIYPYPEMIEKAVNDLRGHPVVGEFFPQPHRPD